VGDLVLSKSSVNSYLNCPLQWWFTYVLAAEGEMSEPATTGIAVHDLAEQTLNTGEPQSWQATDPNVRSLAMLWEKEVWPTIGKPLAVESQFIIDVDDVLYSGYVDYVTEGYLLCDLKTTGRKPQPGKYRLDMVGYWLGCRSLGIDTVAMRLDYLVRTQKPYYLPEMQDIPEDWEVEQFAATLSHVREDIDAGLFPPTGLTGWACRFCNHRNICGPYAAMPQKESNSADAA